MRGAIMLEQLGANVAKVVLGEVRILFSYGTAVAAWVDGPEGLRRYSVTGISPTTAKHVNQHGPRKFVRTGDHHEVVTEHQLERILLEAIQGREETNDQ